MFNVKMHTESIDNLRQQVNNPHEFWKLASKMARTQALGFDYPEKLGAITTLDHPKYAGTNLGVADKKLLR